MRLIAGLGNPESRYDNTFHNMGFNMVNEIAASYCLKFKKLECRAITTVKKDLILAKPQTYMNLSGESIQSLLVKYKIDFSDVMIIYDDIDLPVGSIRIRKGGSGGTHNGMRNIISCIGSENFPRMRIGIGRPPEGMDLADYVLSGITRKDHAVFEEVSRRVVQAAHAFADGESIEELMSKYNG